MLTKEKIVLKIEAYKTSIDEVNSEFLQHCNGWDLGQLPKQGKLGSIEYQFHGIGCRAKRLGQVIDFDYNNDEYIEDVSIANIHLIVKHFDIYRFFNFIESSPDQDNIEGLVADCLKPFFEELVAEGKLVQPDPMYYTWHFIFPSFTVI